jgi:hypothetical protein
LDLDNSSNKTHRFTGTNYYVLFLVTYFIILIYLANRLYIWEDEGYSLHTSSHNLKEVIRLSYNFEGQPPFYFVLLSIWRNINASVFFARLLSIACIGSAAYFFHKLSSLITNRADNYWTVILFLLNPFTVWAGMEIRLYALVILLSTSACYYFLLYYLNEKNKYLYILLVITLIGLYTQYFIAFLIAAFGLSLLIFKGWKRFLNFCLHFIPVLLLFLPNFVYFPQQLSMAQTHLDVNTENLFDVIRTPQDFLLALNTLKLNQTLRWIIKVPFILLLVVAVFKLILFEKPLNSVYFKVLKVIFLTLILCLILFATLIPALSLIFMEKYMFIIFPLLLLFYSLFKAFKWRIWIYISISIYFISLLLIKYHYPEKTYNFEKVSNFLKKVEFKNEPIIFYGKSILPPFQFYYSGNNPLYTLPKLNYDKDYYEERMKDTTDFKRELDAINSSSSSYLLVTESISGYKYKETLTRQMIQQLLRNHYQISLDTTFYSRNSINFLRIERLEK